ncbi:MAG: PAS domain S-box protein [Anaerolineae bacterium]|nr:PAS domain S-box protein [Anaerolineae bacterium]
MHLPGLMSVGAGASIYHLLVILALGAMALIALIEWRHTRNPDHRRIVMTFAALLTLRVPLVIVASTGWAFIAPLVSSLEATSLMLLGWAFLAPVLDRQIRKASLAVGIGLIALGTVASLAIWAGILAPIPASMRAELWRDLYDESWLLPLWLAMSGALALAPSLTLLTRRRGEEHWMAVAGFAILTFGFSVMFVGSALRVIGQSTSADHSMWMGWGRLFNLVGYSLFAVAVYRTAMQDMWTYRQELQTMSEEALRQAKELFFLVETSRSIGDSLDLDAILQRVVESTTMAMDADRAAIFLIASDDPGTATLAAQYTPLQRAELAALHPSFSLADQPTLDYALQRRKQLTLNEKTDNPRLKALYGLLGSQEAGPTIVQPLLRQRATLGALVVGNDHSRRAFDPNKGRLCQSVAAQVTAAIENARLYRDLQAQATQLAELLQSQEDEGRRRMAILESIAEGVVVSDSEGRIIIANVAAERILGTARKRILGRSLKHLTGHTALDPSTDWGMIADSNTPLQTVFELEGKVVHISAAPVLTPSGDKLGIVAILRDISRETEGERAKSEFITSISHELRTPLTAIRGYAEALGGGMVGPLSDAQSHFLGIIRDNALRMGGLTENLIAISELEKGGLKLEYAETDIHLAVGDIVSGFQNELEARQLELVLMLDDDLSTVEADPARIRQILNNLISNAVKFTYPGGRITIGANLLRDEEEQASTHCAIWVEDTGIGISPDEQAHIWERFYRPSSPLAAEASGLGVGLSIVKSLVEAHNGRVWLESTPGAGSKFTVLLPVKRTRQTDG